MAKKSLIKNYAETGPCELDIEEVIKQWNDKFVIFLHKSNPVLGDGDQYRLIVYKRLGREATNLKVTITPEQAIELINRLELKEVKDSIFILASHFKTRDCIQREYTSLFKLMGKKYEEINQLQRISDTLSKVLYPKSEGVV